MTANLKAQVVRKGKGGACVAVLLFFFDSDLADFWAPMVWSKAAPWFLSDKCVSVLVPGPGTPPRARPLPEHYQTLLPSN